MDRLLGAMVLFIEYPILAAVVGLGLLGLGQRARRRFATGVGLACSWLAWGVTNVTLVHGPTRRPPPE
jgi:hypothetical protein